MCKRQVTVKCVYVTFDRQQNIWENRLIHARRQISLPETNHWCVKVGVHLLIPYFSSWIEEGFFLFLCIYLLWKAWTDMLIAECQLLIANC